MADVRDELSAGLVTALAGEFARAWPAFPRDRFVHDVACALSPLALMERVRLVADRLGATLPGDFSAAADVLWRALESATFTGWMTLPCGSYVADAGLEHPTSRCRCSRGSRPGSPAKARSDPSSSVIPRSPSNTCAAGPTTLMGGLS